MKALIVLACLLSSTLGFAQEPGDVISVDKEKQQIRFYIGDIDVKVGELLYLKNSRGVRDVEIEVIEVAPPHAFGEVRSIKVDRSLRIENLQSKRKVSLIIEESEIYSAYFFFGPSFSAKVGEFGGSNYGLGLGLFGGLPFWTDLNLKWSFVLQADDLGKDSTGNGKRTSYYMIGLGKTHKNLQYFAHVGVADNMTMPDGGKTVVDPFTGAQFPDNVQHVNQFGYLVLAKYFYPVREINRNNAWGWGLGPYVSAGGSFGTSAYKSTYTVGVSFDFQNAF